MISKTDSLLVASSTALIANCSTPLRTGHLTEEVLGVTKCDKTLEPHQLLLKEGCSQTVRLDASVRRRCCHTTALELLTARAGRLWQKMIIASNLNDTEID